jgi:hypothetical protein
MTSYVNHWISYACIYVDTSGGEFVCDGGKFQAAATSDFFWGFSVLQAVDPNASQRCPMTCHACLETFLMGVKPSSPYLYARRQSARLRLRRLDRERELLLKRFPELKAARRSRAPDTARPRRRSG